MTRRISLATAGLLVGILVIGGLALHNGPRTYVLEFPTAKSLYVGNDVDVLGVKVGEVTSIKAQRDRVLVRVKVDGDQLIPRDAKAAIVSPSLVPVRSVALFPAYNGGPALQDGAVVPLSRTAVPQEWDDIKTQLVRLEDAVGPNGANRKGALNRLLDASAANLDGEGDNINRSIADMSEAMATLADNRGDIFATVRNLQVFTTALASSDHQVDLFNRRLAGVAGVLADNRVLLARVLRDLERTFKVLRSFISDNRDSTLHALDGLADITALLARNRQKIADILQAGPTTLSNFYNIYDPDVPAMTGTLAAQNFDSPAQFICSTLYSLGGTQEDCESALGPVAQFFKIGQPPVGITPFVRDGSSRVDNSTLTDPEDIAAASGSSSGSTAPAKSTTSSHGSAALLGDLLTGVAP